MRRNSRGRASRRRHSKRPSYPCQRGRLPLKALPHLGASRDYARTSCREPPACSCKVAPTQDRPASTAGWSAAQSASGATTFLRSEKGPPGFPPRPRPKAGPRSPLSMLRLCALAEQTSLPRTTVAAAGSCITRASASSRRGTEVAPPELETARVSLPSVGICGSIRILFRYAPTSTT